MNTFRNIDCNGDRHIGAAKTSLLIAVSLLLIAAGGAKAIDPSRAMSQYARSVWAEENGFPGGTIYAINQTGDGYLWIGTEKGLVRFDGTNFRTVPTINGTSPSQSDPILGLASDSHGDLWVRLRNSTIQLYRDGRFENALSKLQTELLVTAMNQGTNGQVLLATVRNGIVKKSGDQFEKIRTTDNLPNAVFITMAETADGSIWLGSRDAGLLRLKDSQVTQFTKELPDRKINCLTIGSGNELWIGTDKGLTRWSGTEFTSSGVPADLGHVQILAMARDSDGNIWIGTDSKGLLRLDAQGRISADSGPTAPVTAIFEDRERNIWAGTAKGLERIRDTAFVTYSTGEGLPSEANGPIYVDSQNRTWFAPAEGGLYWIKDNKVGKVDQDGIDKDVIYSISGDKDGIWLGRQRGGLSNVRFDGDSFATQTYTDGIAQKSVYAVYRAIDGSIWAGTLSGGISRWQDGKFTNYSTTDGLGSNTITAIDQGADGRIWVATPNGLNLFSDGRWQKYTTRDGLPSDTINCLFEDLSRVMWIGTAKGLAFIGPEGIQTLIDPPDALGEQIVGIEEDNRSQMWLATDQHVLRIGAEVLTSRTVRETDIRFSGIEDGLKSLATIKRTRTVVKDGAGHIWFSTGRGISAVDPEYLNRPNPPALVQIQNVISDGKQIDVHKGVDMPAIQQQRVTFNFAALSLGIPERVRYRYMLDGYDHGWSDPSPGAEASYTNLNPGSYTFRVIASNSEGAWNSPEATLRVEIKPLYWQTWWVRALAALGVVMIFAAGYRYRMHRLTQQLNMRFDERLAERTRIAQDLHDSLLQGVLSASLQLDVEVENLPESSPLRPRLTRIHELMGQVITEGRNTLKGLRGVTESELGDLKRAFSGIKHDLAIDGGPDFRIIVEGTPRALHPVVRDEVFRIGREALVNAFRHAGANAIEAEMEYTSRHFKLVVRDDGCGIDPKILRSGREGHWGLSGMRERAEKIGGQFKVWSRSGGGTEIELTVANHIAFETTTSDNAFGRVIKIFKRPVDKRSR